MATSAGNVDEHLISTGFYRILSDIVGSECTVNIRRQQPQINDALTNCISNKTSISLISGSTAEGFDFKSSDLDFMFVDKNAVVASRLTLCTLLYHKVSSILVLEADNTSPGFTFVKCVRLDEKNEELSSSLVFRDDEVYVSSKHIRESFMTRRISNCHGPCQTVTMYGIESDSVYALNCPTWPKQAIPFITRSLDRGWPSYDVLKDICKDGCLLVPMNSKQHRYRDMIDLEWRISFSLAEKKLVHSMNHCQFLCYGLSKLFLNKVLKKIVTDDGLLCSYFMKTAVLWEIADNSSEWKPMNLLSKFWNVFRRLIKWVSNGYCPNFFIPENNMFYGKIYGETQTTLFAILRSLYSEGYNCLLPCSSPYQFIFSHIISQPEISYFLNYNTFSFVIEYERICAILMFGIPVVAESTYELLKTLQNVLTLRPQSIEMFYAKWLCIRHIIHRYAEYLFLSCASVSSTYHQNRKQYRDIITSYRIISRTKTLFCMNYFILIRLMYKAGNYEKTIEIIHYCKRKLQSQPYMYIWNLDLGIIMTSLQHGMSHDTLFKSFVVKTIEIYYQNTIDELMLECCAAVETVGPILLQVPPLVYLNFLLILSYTRLHENQRRSDALHELTTLVHHDNGYHIKFKATSWEILGICQQLCGDRDGALQSYLWALNDEQNFFKGATLNRIKSLYYYY